MNTTETTTKDTTKTEKQAVSSPRGPLTKNKKPDRRKKGGRGGHKQHMEFDQKIIDIRRVTRVVSGGRRFSFSVAVVIGDHKGKVGVGLGKSGDTGLAITKAVRAAKKNMITVPLSEDRSIPFDIQMKFKASRLEMFPAPGRGLVAGSSVRDVLELAGITDVNAKLLSRSKSKINNARVAILALKKLEKIESKL